MTPSVALAGAAASVLLVVLTLEWLPGGAPVVTDPPPRVAVRGAANETDTVAKDTEGWARTIVARPLFAPTRRPPKNAEGRNAVASTGLPRLSGIMISRAGKRAIFSPEGGKAETLAEGATLDDYTIRKISADRVVLSGAKGDMVLTPSYDGARAGGGPEMGQPGFQPPGFNPGFRPPGFQPMQPPPAPAAAANASDDDSDDDATPPSPPVSPQPFPGFRGPLIPRGRNNE
jgi:hypothetical protein